MPPTARALEPRSASRRATLAAATWLLMAELDRGGPADPLVALWRDWRDAHAAATRLCRRAQRLERDLAGRIGFPRVRVPVDGAGAAPVYAAEARDIDHLLGTGRATRALRARLKRDLAAAQARWTAEAEACGLTDARAGEDAADRRAAALIRTAAATPAQSFAGVIARLAIATEWSVHEPEADGQPWAILRGALADLLILADAARPPSEDR